jgi:CHAD domain-containing protein
MARVLEECDTVSGDFGADPVHDLRVSLRRCRSLADGLLAIDSDPNWKAMKKAGKRLFQRLGALRDVHVMMEWVEKLSVVQEPAITLSESQSYADEAPKPATTTGSQVDTAADALLKILRCREEEQKLEAQAALQEFDRKQWRHWSKSLPRRAARFRPGSAIFKHLALERWTEAHELHSRALRNRSQIAFHSLRIGIKRFRYIVENFLPAEHKLWSDDLKEIQDILGEVHDLDVLWATALSSRVFPDDYSRRNWHERVVSERGKRIERYRSKMTGADSLWQVWRAGLPQGKQIQLLATRRVKLWASGLDPDFPHSERVAGFALQLYDGLLAAGLQPAIDAASARSSLLAAALLHDVGKSAGQKGHHKASYDLIRSHRVPLGWGAAELQRAAVVARFHRGALPTRRHKLLRDLLPDEQKASIQLAAILRVANAFDARHDDRIRRIQIQGIPAEKVRVRTQGFGKRPNNGLLHSTSALVPNGALVIAAEGYTPHSAAAQTIAAERHLLETVLRRPILVKPMRNSMAIVAAKPSV